MTDDANPRDTDRNQEAVDNIRRTLAEGFSFVRGIEVRDGIAAMTYSEMLARAVTEIEEDDTDIRPSKLNAIRSMKQRVLDAVEQARQLPEEMFVLSNQTPDQGMSTREDGTGQGDSEE